MADKDGNGKVPVYVLYGSQTGNSEQHAKDFCTFIEIEAKKRKDFGYSLETHHSQLDDFLELEHADFPKAGALLVIFVSSYGVGQAPLGAYRFRDVCNHWQEQNEKGELKDKPMQGLQYAICGLGDSRFPTFFQNPTAIDAALTVAGATRIGDVGKADAKQSGDNAQDKVIYRWRESVAPLLLDAIPQIRKVPDERLKMMQQSVLEVLVEVDPDYAPPSHVKLAGKERRDAAVTQQMLAMLLIAVLVAVLAFFLSSSS